MIKKFNKFVNYILFFIVICSSFSALSGLIYYLFKASFNTTLKYIIILVTLATIFNYREKFLPFIKMMKDNLKITFITSFIVIFALQIFLIFRVNLYATWDVDNVYAIVKTLFYKKDLSELFHTYISRYPNNRFIMFMFYHLANLFRPLVGEFAISRHFFQLINIIFLDFSIYLTAFSLYKIFDKDFSFKFLLLSIPLMFSVYIFFPYTDYMVLPFIAISIFLFTLKDGIPKYLMLGVSSALAYLMKPSSIIYLFAIFILMVLLLIDKEGKNRKKKLIYSLATFISLIFVIKIFSFYCSNQNLIKFKRSEEFPPNHFIAMGLSNFGAYNHRDVLDTAAQKSRKAKIKYNNRKIVKRIRDMKYIGYAPFLFTKLFATTTFGSYSPYWEQRGAVIDVEDEYILSGRNRNSIESREKYKQINNDFFKSFYFTNAKNRPVMDFVYQIIYIFVWIGVFLSLRHSNEDELIIQIFKLSLLGAFTFLMLFESGRSRYLIQYIFYIYILSIYGYRKYYLTKI
ncbi:hypothetical protein [Helcococcus kunzii]|uniref:hypothetical protein n=1 Tax=Helcococcus kunzii TaxID=40091 RepID=UPI0024AD6E9C|nr:hypothetical protein [Helcococcus kunzii]